MQKAKYTVDFNEEAVSQVIDRTRCHLCSQEARNLVRSPYRLS
jgi:hypothetical protein